MVAGLLEPGVSRAVLDAGCGPGRNSIYLAQQGHAVVGVTNNAEEVGVATALARKAGVATACTFVEGDVRRLPSLGTFDVVLFNEVQFFAKSVLHRVMASLRALTRQGGLNVVSGYVVRPGTANAANTEHYFAPQELRLDYEEAGWNVLFYDENYYPNQYTGSGAAVREHIFSRARLLASRPWPPVIAKPEARVAP